MSIPRQLSEYLDSQQVRYQFHTHAPAYTAQGLAHIEHVSGKELAKVVMVMVDGRIVMSVLPASHRLDLDKFAELQQAQSVRLATEDEFRDVFPDCELGAMPPFGNLYHLDVWVDSVLRSHATIVFNAGSHVETILMNFSDFERLVNPKVASFSVLRH